MNELGHNDEEQVKSLRSFILPSIQEVFLYSLISFGIILLTNFSTILSLFSDYSGVNSVFASDSISEQMATFNLYFGSELLGKVSVFIIWGLIGCLSYMAVWGIQHFYVRVRNDAEESAYEQNKKRTTVYWESRASQHILIIADTIIFACLIFSVFYVVPFMGTLGRITMQNLASISDYKYFLAGLIIGTAYMHIIARMWRVTRYVYGMYFSGTED